MIVCVHVLTSFDRQNKIFVFDYIIRELREICWSSYFWLLRLLVTGSLLFWHLVYHYYDKHFVLYFLACLRVWLKRRWIIPFLTCKLEKQETTTINFYGMSGGLKLDDTVFVNKLWVFINIIIFAILSHFNFKHVAVQLISMCILFTQNHIANTTSLLILILWQN